jgi:hypothetical protein
MHRIGPVWRLANNHFSCGSAAQSIDGAPGRRRANGWRTVPGLGTAISVSHIAARGHRDPRQPQQPQGGWSEGSHYCGAGHAALSAAVFARPEPHRKVFRQTQSAASSSRRAQRRLPLGENRSSAQHRLLNRVPSLLCFFGICVHLNQKCSRAFSIKVFTLDDTFCQYRHEQNAVLRIEVKRKCSRSGEFPCKT